MKIIAPLHVFLTLFFIANMATAETRTLQATVAQADSVDAAVELVTRHLEKQGFDIPLVVNHSASAASVGLDLRPTQVIFARPPRQLERSLLRRSNTVALDLPFKYLIFADDKGDLQLRSNPVGYLIDRHQLRIHDFSLYITALLANQFGAGANGLVSVASERSVQDTVQALQDAIAASGAFRIPLVLDFGTGSQRQGPVLIVFGNPNAGTPLMQASQEIGIDLPQKFLVSKSKDGVTITYNDPLFIARRANLVGQDERLNGIANALANFAAAGAGTGSND